METVTIRALGFLLLIAVSYGQQGNQIPLPQQVFPRPPQVGNTGVFTPGQTAFNTVAGDPRNINGGGQVDPRVFQNTVGQGGQQGNFFQDPFTPGNNFFQDPRTQGANFFQDPRSQGANFFQGTQGQQGGNFFQDPFNQQGRQGFPGVAGQGQPQQGQQGQGRGGPLTLGNMGVLQQGANPFLQNFQRLQQQLVYNGDTAGFGNYLSVPRCPLHSCQRGYRCSLCINQGGNACQWQFCQLIHPEAALSPRPGRPPLSSQAMALKNEICRNFRCAINNECVPVRYHRMYQSVVPSCLPSAPAHNCRPGINHNCPYGSICTANGQCVSRQHQRRFSCMHSPCAPHQRCQGSGLRRSPVCSPLGTPGTTSPCWQHSCADTQTCVPSNPPNSNRLYRCINRNVRQNTFGATLNAGVNAIPGFGSGNPLTGTQPGLNPAVLNTGLNPGLNTGLNANPLNQVVGITNPQNPVGTDLNNRASNIPLDVNANLNNNNNPVNGVGQQGIVRQPPVVSGVNPVPSALQQVLGK